MCGSLKRENNSSLVGKDPFAGTWGKPGGKFRITLPDSSSHTATFNGHARKETLKDVWLSKGWKSADLHVSAYTEQGRTYEVPSGYVLSAVVRDIPKHGKIFNIVTRPAKGAELDVHDRFPIMRKPQF